MNIYREIILDHYRNPRNFGRLRHPDKEGYEANPICGDEVRLTLKVSEGIIKEVRFEGRGCALSTASASLLTERLKGMPLTQAETLSKENILELLGTEITPARLKCALLPLKALRNAL